jgi:hypothetical protein
MIRYSLLVLLSAFILVSCTNKSNADTQIIDKIKNANYAIRGNASIFSSINTITTQYSSSENLKNFNCFTYYIKKDSVRVDKNSTTNKQTSVGTLDKGFVTQDGITTYIESSMIDKFKTGLAQESSPYEPPFFEKEVKFSISYVGKQTLPEGICEVVRFVDKSDPKNVFDYYFLSDGTDVKMSTKKLNGTNMDTYEYSYKEILPVSFNGSLMNLPRIIELKINGKISSVKTYKKIDFNQKISESLFIIP